MLVLSFKASTKYRTQPKKESSYKNVSKRFSEYAVLYISGTEHNLIVSQVKRFNTENPQSQYNRKVNDHLNTAFRRI